MLENYSMIIAASINLPATGPEAGEMVSAGQPNIK